MRFKRCQVIPLTNRIPHMTTSFKGLLIPGMTLFLWSSWPQTVLDPCPDFTSRCFSLLARVCRFVRFWAWEARYIYIFMVFSLGYNHQQMSEGQRQKPEFYSRTASESNVYLNSFHYSDRSYKDQAYDTLSLDSSDSMETSISACSPDNISR